MIRALSACFVTLALVASSAQAQVQDQDGPFKRAGRALDQTGKNIRSSIETEVARGQVTAQQRDILSRVGKRIDWDKQMSGSTLRLEVQDGGVVVLQGSVPSEAVKLRAVDLVENTTGVTSVVDQLAVVKEVRVITAKPAKKVATAPVVEVHTPAVVTEPNPNVIVRP